MVFERVVQSETHLRRREAVGITSLNMPCRWKHIFRCCVLQASFSSTAETSQCRQKPFHLDRYLSSSSILIKTDPGHIISTRITLHRLISSVRTHTSHLNLYHPSSSVPTPSYLYVQTKAPRDPSLRLKTNSTSTAAGRCGCASQGLTTSHIISSQRFPQAFSALSRSTVEDACEAARILAPMLKMVAVL